MSNTKTHAQRELEILSKITPDALILPFQKEIFALCDAFGRSGQSGGSAPYVAKAVSLAINKLLMQETIAPLTGEDSEWIDQTTANDGEILFQNNRDSRVFKDGSGRSWFLDAIVFDGDVGGRFTGSGIKSKKGLVSSRQFIRSFPFEPKTFYVNVMDYRWRDKEETIPDDNGDWWSHAIVDEAQLIPVFEYYQEEMLANDKEIV